MATQAKIESFHGAKLPTIRTPVSTTATHGRNFLTDFAMFASFMKSKFEKKDEKNPYALIFFQKVANVWLIPELRFFRRLISF